MADADEHVLEPMAVRIGVVDLVGDDRRQAGLLGQLGELCDEPVVVGLQVMAQLDGKVAVTEARRPGARNLQGRVALAGQQEARNPAVPAARQAEQVPARVFERRLDERPVEDRELLLARQVAAARQPGERGVAIHVARQQDEVVTGDRAGMVLAWPAPAGLLAAKGVVQLAATARQAELVIRARDGDLDADDRAYRLQARLAGGIGLGLLRRLPCPDRRVQTGVIGDCQRGQRELSRAGDQLLGMRGTVEKLKLVCA